MKSSTQLGLFCLYIISLCIELIYGIDDILRTLSGMLFMGFSIILMNLWDNKPFSKEKENTK